MQVQEPVVAYRRTATNATNYQGLNPAQLHVLKMLSFIKTEETFQDLKKVLREFYIRQVEKEAEKYWNEGMLSDDLLHEHLRTPYQWEKLC